MAFDAATLAALGAKYAELVALAREREVLEGQGVMRLEGAEGAARAARCRALAQKFPASLRELDGMSAAQLEYRLRAVEALVAGSAAVPEWLRLVVALHDQVRQAQDERVARRAVDRQGGLRYQSGDNPTLMNRIFQELSSRFGRTPDELRAVAFAGSEDGR